MSRLDVSRITGMRDGFEAFGLNSTSNMLAAADLPHHYLRTLLRLAFAFAFYGFVVRNEKRLRPDGVLVPSAARHDASAILDHPGMPAEVDHRVFRRQLP